MTSQTTMRIGVLLFPDFQYQDLAGPVDYIGNHSKRYLSMVGAVPPHLLDKAAHIEWHYISHTLDPVTPTSGPTHNPTCTYADCPTIDYLIVPGPDPTAPLPEGCAAFLQKLVKEPQFKAMLLICIGALAVAQSGILDGRKVCSNKLALKSFAQHGILNKNVKWVGDRRWIVDGAFWSSAGITSGLDLAAEFARVHFDDELVKLVEDLSEYEPKPAQPDTFARITEGVDL